MFSYLIWLLTATLYAPVFFTLYRSGWSISDCTHAYFVLPISCWLVWRKRAILRDLIQKAEHRCNFLGLSILIFGLLMFVFSWRQGYQFITTLSLVPVLYGLLRYLYGFHITKALSFPVFYLVLLAPIPTGILDTFTLPMRYGVSIGAEAILKLFHYPITREGLLLYIGNSELFIGQPCSGFRSLITMISLSSVYVYISKSSLPKKAILISCIIPLSLLGNLIRIIILCLITYHFGEEAGQGFFHTFSGALVFLITLLGLIGIEYLLGKVRTTR